MAQNWKAFCTIDAQRRGLSVTNGKDTKAEVAAEIGRDPKVTFIRVFGPIETGDLIEDIPVDRLTAKLSAAHANPSLLPMLIEQQVHNGRRVIGNDKAVGFEQYKRWVAIIAEIIKSVPRGVLTTISYRWWEGQCWRDSHEITTGPPPDSNLEVEDFYATVQTFIGHLGDLLIRLGFDTLIARSAVENADLLSAPADHSSPTAVPVDSHLERGAHFESYVLLRQLIQTGKTRLTIVDPYIDDQILSTIRLLPKAVTVQILTEKIQAPDFCVLLRKLRKEGWKIRAHTTKEFHDRYLRIDDECWHSGHSLKDLGSRDSRLSKVQDPGVIADIDKRIAEALKTATEICP